MSNRYDFLLISNTDKTYWCKVLAKALSPLGELRTVSQDEAISSVIQNHLDVIIIDTRNVSNAVLMLSQLRASRPDMRVVIVTSSPTWRRAREALRAGAADYINKSLDKNELRKKIQAVLETPSPVR